MAKMTGVPKGEAYAMLDVRWGDPMLANLAGTSARASGADGVRATARSMTTAPEPLDLGEFGNPYRLQGLLPWLPDPSEATDEVLDALPQTQGGLAGLLKLPPDLGSRIGWGALGGALVVVGAWALVSGGGR